MMWMLLLLPAEAKKVPVCWIKTSKGIVYDGRTTVTFVSGEEAAAREAKRAAATMEPPLPTPKNGWVEVHIERLTIGLADLGNQVFVIEGAGQELLRREPEPDVANTPNRPLPWWWNTAIVPMPDEIAYPLVFWAADSVLAHRCGWMIEAPGARPVLVE